MGQEDTSPFTESMASSTGYLLYLAGAEARRRWAQMLAELALTPHQFGVLMVLDQHGAMSQREVSRLLGIDPRNAVPVIDALQRRELVERRTDPLDRRRHAITVTAAGSAVVEELKHGGTAMEEALLEALLPAERATLHGLLHKLYSARTHTPAKR
jgi:DNA-binding MarR family transcriptional regulator